MRSRGNCSGSGRRAGLRRSNDGTVTFSLVPAAPPTRAAPAFVPPPFPPRPPPPPQPRRLGLCSILFQIGELKLKLIKQRAALRGLSEPLVPQLPDRVFELLDQQRAILCLALGRPQCRPLHDDQRMGAGEM